LFVGKSDFPPHPNHEAAWQKDDNMRSDEAVVTVTLQDGTELKNAMLLRGSGVEGSRSCQQTNKQPGRTVVRGWD